MSAAEETPTPDVATSSPSVNGRRNNNGGNGQRNKKKTSFKGEIDELGSHVFTTPHEDPYKSQDYRKNIEAFELYFERSFSNPDDMICVLSNQEPKKLITPDFLDMSNCWTKMWRASPVELGERSSRWSPKSALRLLGRWVNCATASGTDF